MCWFHGNFNNKTSMPSQHVISDNTEKATCAVDAYETVGTPLVWIWKATFQRVPLRVEDCDANTILRVSQVLYGKTRTCGRRLDDCSAIPTYRANFLDCCA